MSSTQPIEVCVRVIVIRNRKVLVCRHLRSSYYFFPGGHVECGEHAIRSLRREIREEAGIALQQVRFGGVVENFFTQAGEKHHEINLVFSATISNSRVRSRERHITFSWIPIQQMRRKKIYPRALRDAVYSGRYKHTPFWITQKDSQALRVKIS